MWLSDGALLSSHSHHDAGVNCSELAHQASFWPSQGMFLFLCSRFLRLLPSDFTSHLPPPAPANRLRMPKIKYFTLHTVCLTVSKSKSVYSCSECPKLKVVQRACHHPPGSIPLPPKSLSKSSCLFVCLMQWVTEMEIKEPVCSSKNRRLSAGRTASEPSFLHTSCYVVSEHFCSFLQHSQLAALHVAVQFSCLHHHKWLPCEAVWKRVSLSPQLHNYPLSPLHDIRNATPPSSATIWEKKVQNVSVWRSEARHIN